MAGKDTVAITVAGAGDPAGAGTCDKTGEPAILAIEVGMCRGSFDWRGRSIDRRSLSIPVWTFGVGEWGTGSVGQIGVDRWIDARSFGEIGLER